MGHESSPFLHPQRQPGTRVYVDCQWYGFYMHEVELMRKFRLRSSALVSPRQPPPPYPRLRRDCACSLFFDSPPDGMPSLPEIDEAEEEGDGRCHKRARRGSVAELSSSFSSASLLLKLLTSVASALPSLLFSSSREELRESEEDPTRSQDSEDAQSQETATSATDHVGARMQSFRSQRNLSLLLEA